MNRPLESLTTDQLGDYYSDFSKEIYGFRARDIVMSDRAGLIEGIRKLHATFNRMCSTKEGRNDLRDQGWNINEPATAEQDGWVDWIERLKQEDAAKERAAEEAKGEAIAGILAYDTTYDHIEFGR
jgi:hypothetical protein